jgi:Trehalose-6-phosphate synthase
VVVANRLPVRRTPEGWETSPGGLVSAIYPFLKDRGGAWVGWDGSESEPGRSDPPAPFTHDGIQVRPVPLSSAEVESFYHGFSNETLWPLYHDAIRTPQFHRRWWHPYREVNMRFAQLAVEASADRDLIWVQDYQLQLVPGYVRLHRPRARIGYFNHIPFPPEELFAKLPWRQQILEGLLGADVVGFQTKLAAQNFSRAARQFTSAKGTDTRLEFQGRTVVVDAFPISIDFDRYSRAAGEADVSELSTRLRESLDGRRILLGVDRLDYTKGIDIRLRAFEELLERGRIGVDDTCLVQVAVPTREAVEDYAELRSTVEELVGRVNGTHGRLGRVAVHYIYRSLPWAELLACYRAADAMVVTPLRDGMNLVAKEYVACRNDDSGALVLSEFAGAALELKQALLVNPHDVDGMADAMERALTIAPADARRRMAAMRRTVGGHTVYDWSDSFLRVLSA